VKKDDDNNAESKPQSATGVPVDATGGPTIDPTKNVLDLVKAAVQRIDDLRDAETKRVDEKIQSEKDHTREIMQLRADHENDLREAEAKRIDAIRIVDVNAVAVNIERAASQAAVLAQQVTNTASTATQQLDGLTKLLTDRIAALEKVQYEGVGKERITDPLMQQLLTEMKNTRTALAEGTGQGRGLNQGWVYLLGAGGLIGAILGIISFFR
jgi:hypothetical protein